MELVGSLYEKEQIGLLIQVMELLGLVLGQVYLMLDMVYPVIQEWEQQ